MGSSAGRPTTGFAAGAAGYRVIVQHRRRAMRREGVSEVPHVRGASRLGRPSTCSASVR
jgi:hypothetical protein